MPELPEVETVRRGLTRLVVGRTVQGTAVGGRKQSTAYHRRNLMLN